MGQVAEATPSAHEVWLDRLRFGAMVVLVVGALVAMEVLGLLFLDWVR